MSLPLQDQANILHGIRGGWTMRSKIVNVVLLGEVAIFHGSLGSLIERFGLILLHWSTLYN